MHRRTSQVGMLTAVLIPLLMAAAPATSGNGNGDDSDEEIPFDVAELFFELNDTDGDLGIHAFIDGEPWKRLEIEDIRERKMLDIRVKGRLRRQGLTEIFFESAEPTFDELPPEKFFRRFPAGEYEIEGETIDGEELESETELTHLIPAPAGNVTINGIPARPLDGSDCDEEDLPELTGPVVLEWDAVTESHPELGEEGDVEVIRYQAVTEWENEDELTFVSSVELSPQDGVDRYSITVAPEFFVDESEVKFEVLAREESFNQTAVESCPFEYVD